MLHYPQLQDGDQLGIEYRYSSHQFSGPYLPHMCAVGISFLFLPQKEYTPVRTDQYPSDSIEEMMRQLQQTIEAMQWDVAPQEEVTARQTEFVAQQAELIAKLQQQQQPQQQKLEKKAKTERLASRHKAI